MPSVHSQGTYTTAAAAPSVTYTKLEKVWRPTISAAGSSEDWWYFLTRWGGYVAATNVTGKDKVIKLLECCDKQLRKALTRNAGGSLTDKTAAEVMEASKKLAVLEENTMVARVELHNMHQDQDKTICSFGAHLCGQAGVCKFLVTCNCPGCNAEVNYTENILHDVLTRSLANSKIQLDLLGDRNQDVSLEEVFQFIEAKEAGKWSAGSLSQSQGVDAAHSQYWRTKQDEIKHHKDGDNKGPCSYRNKRGYGKSTLTRIRWHDCPAYGTICDKCRRQNHFASLCCSKGKSTRPRKPTSPSGNTRETESAIFDSLCTATSLDNMPGQWVISLDHHLLPPHWPLDPTAIQAPIFHHTYSNSPPWRLHSTGIQPPPPPHHGWHLYNSPLYPTQAARAAWLA